MSERVRDTRERASVSQRVNKCAGVRRVPQILAHGKQINFAVCPNLGTRQILTTSAAGPHGAMFAVCLTEAHGKM